ncbi:hypothetical protein FB480_101945 [Agrobacterium vitis]|nr:hypothetical protein FB480_101945 [Agrobacterium vitis]
MTVQYLGDCYAFVQVVAAYLSHDGYLGRCACVTGVAALDAKYWVCLDFWAIYGVSAMSTDLAYRETKKASG